MRRWHDRKFGRHVQRLLASGGTLLETKDKMHLARCYCQRTLEFSLLQTRSGIENCTLAAAYVSSAALVLCTPPFTVRIMLKRQSVSNVGRDPTRSAAGRERRKALVQARRDGPLAKSARFATGDLGM